MKQKSKPEIVNGIYVVHKKDLSLKKQPKYKIIEIKKEHKNGNVLL